MITFSAIGLDDIVGYQRKRVYQENIIYSDIWRDHGIERINVLEGYRENNRVYQ
jgi:hypothetical protein